MLSQNQDGCYVTINVTRIQRKYTVGLTVKKEKEEKVVDSNPLTNKK